MCSYYYNPKVGLFFLPIFFTIFHHLCSGENVSCAKKEAVFFKKKEKGGRWLSEGPSGGGGGGE